AIHRFKTQGVFKPVKEAVSGIPNDELKKIAQEKISIRNKYDFNEEEFLEFESLGDRVKNDVDVNEIAEQETLALEELQTLQKQGLITEQDADFVEVIQEL